MNKQLLNKFFSFFFGSFLGAAIGFATTILTARILNPEQFGKASMFTLVLSFSMIFAIFGTDQAFGRFFFEEQEHKRGGLLYSCLKVVLFVLIPFIGLFLLFTEPLSVTLFGEMNKVVMLVLTVGIIIQVFDRFALFIIRMQQKGFLFSIVQILNKTLVLLGVFVLYPFLGESYEILVFSTLFATASILAFLIWSQPKFWSLKNLRLKELRHSKKEILTYSYPLVFTMLLAWLLEGFDKIALRQWADFQELGLYSAAFKIIGLLTIIQGAFTTFWVPVAYETFEKDPENKAFFAKVSRTVAYVMISIAIMVIMFKDLFIFLLGHEYQGASHILSFLVFIPVMYTMSETTVMGINFYKKVKWHIVIALATCAVNVVGNWMLVPSYGGVGAAISTGISYILFFSMRTLISLKYYKVNYGLGRAYLSILVVLIYASFMLIGLGPWIQLSSGVLALLSVSFIYRHDLVNGYVMAKQAWHHKKLQFHKEDVQEKG